MEKKSSNNWFWAIAGIVAIMAITFILFGQNNSNDGEDSSVPTPTQEGTQQPNQVVIDAGSPLSCDLLPEPREIEHLTATYGCQAPGAYLTGIDTSADPWMAGYFTTDSASTQVTYGPEAKKVLEASK